jgi:hypothetical protein
MRPVFHRRNLGYRAEGDDSVARSLEKRTQPTGNSNADSKTPLDDSKQPSRARFLDLTVVEFGGLRDWLAPSGAAKLFTGAGATDALLILPSFSRSSVFSTDRAAAAQGCDAKGWIQKFPTLTGEDGNAKALVQRVFYPIPSAAERLSRLEDSTLPPIFGSVARVNLFLSLATLTILGRCVHCNVGRPELWIFPPSD